MDAQADLNCISWALLSFHQFCEDAAQSLINSLPVAFLQGATAFTLCEHGYAIYTAFIGLKKIQFSVEKFTFFV